MQRARAVAMAVMILATGTVHAQHAQDEPLPTNLWFLRAGYSPGIVLATSPFVSGDNGARAMTVEVGRQTDGTRDWHRVYNYPSYGGGFYAGRLAYERVLRHQFMRIGYFALAFPVENRVEVTTHRGPEETSNCRLLDTQPIVMTPAL